MMTTAVMMMLLLYTERTIYTTNNKMNGRIYIEMPCIKHSRFLPEFKKEGRTEQRNQNHQHWDSQYQSSVKTTCDIFSPYQGQKKKYFYLNCFFFLHNGGISFEWSSCVHVLYGFLVPHLWKVDDFITWCNVASGINL